MSTDLSPAPHHQWCDTYGRGRPKGPCSCAQAFRPAVPSGPPADDQDDERLTAYTCPRWHRDPDGWCVDERPHLAARPSADTETLRAVVLAIHRPMHGYCAVCDRDRDVDTVGNNPDCPHYASYCHEDDFAWPCRTRAALDGER